MVADNSSVLQYIDGLAVHFYANLYTPATILSSFIKKYPSKYIIATEACEGIYLYYIYAFVKMHILLCYENK